MLGVASQGHLYEDDVIQHEFSIYGVIKGIPRHVNFWWTYGIMDALVGWLQMATSEPNLQLTHSVEKHESSKCC